MTIHRSGAGHDLVRVLFRLEPAEWHGSTAETLWAERLDERRCRLRNVPFFVFGVAAEDVIFVRKGESLLEFDGVSIRGGHSAYRIIESAEVAVNLIEKKWQQIEKLGCTYEQGPPRLRAVDVPATADIHNVYALLEAAEGEGIWDFEEGHCGHQV